MGGWQLRREVIDAVLHRVEDDRGRLDDAFSHTRLAEIDEDLTGAGPTAHGVQVAVMLLLNAQMPRLIGISNRVSAATVGVRSAQACYDAGQEEMAASCQAHMVASAASGDFSWWLGSELPAGAV